MTSPVSSKYLSWFNHLNNSMWKGQITKHLITKFSPLSSYAISQAQPFALIPPSSLVFAHSTILNFTHFVFSDTYTPHRWQCHHHPPLSSPQKGRPKETTARIQWQRTDNSKGKILFRFGLLWIKVNTQNNEFFLESDVNILPNTGCSLYRDIHFIAQLLHGHLGSMCDMELVTR